MKYLNQYIFIKTDRETNRPRGSPSDAFYYFIKNSKIEVLSDDSAYGVIFKCIFKKNENWSPYFYVDSNGDLSNVTIIVIKLVLLSDTIIGTDGKPMVEWLFQTKKLEPILKKCDTTKNFTPFFISNADYNKITYNEFISNKYGFKSLISTSISVSSASHKDKVIFSNSGFNFLISSLKVLFF